MSNNIKSAFENIHADDSLKASAKKYVYDKTNGYSKRGKSSFMRIAVPALCSLAVISGGGVISYNIPVAAVSVDINPSVEFELNLYNRVIDVRSNAAFENEELDIKNMEYSKAVNTILNNEVVSEYMDSDNSVEITIISGSENKCRKMQECISAETGVKNENIFCSNNKDNIDSAHSAGISCGRYRAYLELKEIYPDIEIGDILNLTMREIRAMINGGTTEEPSECQTAETAECHTDITSESQENCGSGHGMGNGKGHGKGKNCQD